MTPTNPPAAAVPAPTARTARLGLVLMLATAVCFGLNPLFARYAAADGLGAPAMALYRFGGPALVLLPFCAVARPLWRPALAAMGLGAGVGLGMAAYFQALTVLPVALPAMVYFTYPAFTLLLGRLLFAERIGVRAAVACLCVFAACGLILTPGSMDPGHMDALLLCLAAPLAYALLLHGLARWLTPLPVWSRAGFTVLGAAVALSAILLGGGGSVSLPETARGWTGVIGLMTVCSLLPQVLAVVAVPMLGAGAAAIAGTAELATSLAVGWVVLGEPATAAALSGVALIVAAQWLSVPGRRPRGSLTLRRRLLP